MSYRPYEDYELKFIEDNVQLFDEPERVNALMHSWRDWQIRAAVHFFDKECNDQLFDILDRQIVSKISRLYRDSDMESLYYPGELGVVGTSMFSATKNMKTVVLENGIDTIMGNAFHGSTMTSIKLPSTLKTIEYDAFNGCSNLLEFKIPDSVDEIGCEAFSFMKGLKKLTFPKTLQRIPADCCNQDCELSEVVLPDNVKVISHNAFTGCTNLKDIKLPDGLQELGEMAFFNTGITVLEVPQSVKFIGKHVLGEWRNGSNGYYATSNKTHKYKIRGLNKAEAREYAQKNIRFGTSTMEAEFIRKLI